MGFLSIMGKIVIGLSLALLPVAISLIIIFGDTLGFGVQGIAIALGASVFVFFCGLYAGYLGVKYERLQERFELFVNPLRVRPKAVNLIKAVCPIDGDHVVFVHVSPHRDDERPDGLDIFIGSCGHEVHRGEIEIEQHVDSVSS